MIRWTDYKTWHDFLGVFPSLSVLVGLVIGCTTGDPALDEQESLKSHESRHSAVCELGAGQFPRGNFADRGFLLNYDRLVPLPDPRANFDRIYGEEVVSTPRLLEQLYYDAAHGNERAAWFVCELEISVRNFARSIAEYLSMLDCPVIAQCMIELDKLPYSPDTLSGTQTLMLLRSELETHAASRSIRRELVTRAITVLGLDAVHGCRSPRLELMAEADPCCVSAKEAGGTRATRPARCETPRPPR